MKKVKVNLIIQNSVRVAMMPPSLIKQKRDRALGEVGQNIPKKFLKKFCSSIEQKNPLSLDFF